MSINIIIIVITVSIISIFLFFLLLLPTEVGNPRVIDQLERVRPISVLRFWISEGLTQAWS